MTPNHSLAANYIVSFDDSILLCPTPAEFPRQRPPVPGVIRAPINLMVTKTGKSIVPTSRQVDNIGSRKSISDVYSFKRSAHIRCESTLERDFAELLDWAPNVRTFRSQPERLPLLLEKRTAYTTPDFEFTTYTPDKDHLVEVKPAALACQPKLQARFIAARRSSTVLGRTYSVATEELIRLQPRLKNIKRLRRYARAYVPDAAMSLFRALTAHGSIPLGRFLADARNHHFADAVVYAAMYRSILVFDVHRAIDEHLCICHWENVHD